MDRNDDAGNRTVETIRKLEARGIKVTEVIGSFGFVGGIGSHQKRSRPTLDHQTRLATQESSGRSAPEGKKQKWSLDALLY